VVSSARRSRLRFESVDAWRAGDLDSDAVGIKDKQRIVSLDVSILLRAVMDIRAHLKAPLVGVVHLFARVDKEGDVLDSDVVVAVFAPIRWTQAKLLAAEIEVNDLLGAAVTRIATVLG
jgi:hypothetical protein